MNIPNKLLGHRRARALLGALSIAAGLASACVAAEPRRAADTIAQRALACAACHGKQGQANSDGFFPRIAGKPAGYLYNQLVNFRTGSRHYPMMTYMVGQMSPEYMRELAQYFADLKLPYPAPPRSSASAEMLARGRSLVMSGDATRNIPACISCHGEKLRGLLPSIPGLLGLPRDYLNAEIGAWQSGSRRAAAPDCMAAISKRLRPEEVGAISSWLASQPVAGDASPAPAFSLQLATPCGSAAQ